MERSQTFKNQTRRRHLYAVPDVGADTQLALLETCAKDRYLEQRVAWIVESESGSIEVSNETYDELSEYLINKYDLAIELGMSAIYLCKANIREQNLIHEA